MAASLNAATPSVAGHNNGALQSNMAVAITVTVDDGLFHSVTLVTSPSFVFHIIYGTQRSLTTHRSVANGTIAHIVHLYATDFRDY